MALSGSRRFDPEIRGIVKRNWPHLLVKLPPEEDDYSWTLTVPANRIFIAAFIGVRQWPADTQSICMAKAKKSKPRDHQVRWSISLIKATPAKYLGQVFAANEVGAIKEAVREFSVEENLRGRVVARKEDY
jgi:hypothetical protein